MHSALDSFQELSFAVSMRRQMSIMASKINVKWTVCSSMNNTENTVITTVQPVTTKLAYGHGVILSIPNLAFP